MVDVHPRAGGKDHHIEWDQGQQKVDADEKALGQREDVFGDVHLIDQAEVGDDAAHGQVGGLAEVVEIGKAGEQVNQIVHAGNAEFEHIGKDYGHDRHHQHRVQQTPGHAQHAALVFHLKVPGYELFDQKPVLFQRQHDIADRFHFFLQ